MQKPEMKKAEANMRPASIASPYSGAWGPNTLRLTLSIPDCRLTVYLFALTNPNRKSPYLLRHYLCNTKSRACSGTQRGRSVCNRLLWANLYFHLLWIFIVNWFDNDIHFEFCLIIRSFIKWGIKPCYLTYFLGLKTKNSPPCMTDVMIIAYGRLMQEAAKLFLPNKVDCW